MKNSILIKVLDNEIWMFKDNELIKMKTQTMITNNFITNYKVLLNSLKNMLSKHKVTNTLIQNNILIIINKLYCETNIFVLKNIMYNLGITNYKFIYEEDVYKNLNKKILSFWNDNGIYISNDREFYVDYKTNLTNLVEENALIITANKDILSYINKKILVYENTTCPIFSIIINKKIN